MRTETYDSPLGGLVLAADVEGLAGAWFAGQRHYGEFGSVRHTLVGGLERPGNAGDEAHMNESPMTETKAMIARSIFL